MENFSLAASNNGYLKGLGGGLMGDEKNERLRARTMLCQLIETQTVVKTYLDNLQRRVPQLEVAEDPLAAMREAGLNAGEMALLLSMMLLYWKLTGKRRKSLEDALLTVLSDEGWAVQLFASLEFGEVSNQGLPELRRLYQRAATRDLTLLKWFDEFRGLKDRKRKLKTLIRALAFELSAGEADRDEVHLAAIIGDLRRILQFFSIEEPCQRIADFLTDAGASQLDSDGIMRELLETVQQPWVHADWLADRTGFLVPQGMVRYGFARRMAELVKELPAPCFEDEEQRATIQAAYAEYLDKLADQEEEE
jgi:type III secretion system YopN/LcrE/InvE/MxiC family regulator